MSCVRVFFLFVFFWFIAGNVSLSQQRSGYDALIEVLKEKWIEYLHSLGTVEGVVHIQYKSNGAVSSDFYKEIVCLYPLLMDNRGTHENYDSADVIGKNYRFSLSRSDAESGWIIERIIQEPSNRASKDWNFFAYHDVSSRKDDPAGYGIFNTLGVGLFVMSSSDNLPYYLSSEWLTINDVKEVEHEGEKQLHLSFEFAIPNSPQNSPKQVHYTLKGNVVLLTDFFLISEANFFRKYPSYTEDVIVKIDYDRKTYRVPLPKSYYKKIESCDYSEGRENRSTFEAVNQYDLRETNPKDYTRFTLSNYGLPEPDFAGPRVSWFRITAMAIGVFLIVFTLWRMHLQRKRNKT